MPKVKHQHIRKAIHDVHKEMDRRHCPTEPTAFEYACDKRIAGIRCSLDLIDYFARIDSLIAVDEIDTVVRSISSFDEVSRYYANSRLLKSLTTLRNLVREFHQKNPNRPN